MTGAGQNMLAIGSACEQPCQCPHDGGLEAILRYRLAMPVLGGFSQPSLCTYRKHRLRHGPARSKRDRDLDAGAINGEG